MAKEYWFGMLLVGSLSGAALVAGATEWSHSARRDKRLAQATTPQEERTQPATPEEGKSQATTPPAGTEPGRGG